MTAEPPEPDAEAGAKRKKWIGRAVVLFFGALLLIYFVPLVVSLIHPL